MIGSSKFPVTARQTPRLAPSPPSCELVGSLRGSVSPAREPTGVCALVFRAGWSGFQRPQESVAPHAPLSHDKASLTCGSRHSSPALAPKRANQRKWQNKKNKRKRKRRPFLAKRHLPTVGSVFKSSNAPCFLYLFLLLFGARQTVGFAPRRIIDSVRRQVCTSETR